jgi:hypothetical protein
MPRRRDQSEEIVTTSNATANERLEKWEATEPAEEAATFLKARERRQAALKRIAERPGSWRSRRKVEIGSTIDEGTEVTKASEEIVISAEPTGEERGALERAEVAA